MADLRFNQPSRARGPDPATWILAAALILALGVVRQVQTAEAVESGSPAAATAPAASTVEFDIPRAVFVWDPANTNAVDPFFPQSQRRFRSVTSTKKVEVMDLDTLAERFVFLRGITGPVGDQVALLNNQPLKVGDVFALRLENAEGQQQRQERLTVHLLHIVDDAVVFKVEGGTREHVKQLSEYGRTRRAP
jgi:hypothetical protein